MAKIKVTEQQVQKLADTSQEKETKNSTSEEYEKLLNELDQIANKYNFPLEEKQLVDTDISLERKSQIQKTDDEIKQEAVNSLYEYKQNGLNNIEKENKLANENLVKEIQDAKTNAQTKKQNANDYYDNAKSSAENDALKRGLSRSSIVINTLSAFDQNRINLLNQIDEELTSKIQNLNDQISVLNLEKQKAINDFDVEYATKLNQKISTLKDELNEKNQEVLEYNNKIEQIEKEYKNSAIKTNNDIKQDAYEELLDRVEFFMENGEKINSAVNKENYKAILNFLDQMHSKEALEFLKNNQYLQKMLGNEYSSLLVYLENKG